MNQQQILDSQISRITTELGHYYSERISHQAKVMDATTATGNAVTDAEIQRQKLVSAAALALLDRMIEIRKKLLTELTDDLDALKSTAPAPATEPALQVLH